MVLVGCAAAPRPEPLRPATRTENSGAKNAAPSDAAHEGTASPTRSAEVSGGLPFIEDDYQAALADARAKKRPIFVDVWATWCHTCVSLKNFVFPDPALGAHRDAFTWLAIDSEKAENARLVETLGVQVLPTLWILDPATEKPMWTWQGALTARELSAALTDVETGVARTSNTPAPSAPLAPKTAKALAEAEAAQASGRTRDAMTRYREALSDDSPFPERGRAVDALVTLLSSAKATDECALVASREGPRLPEGTYRSDVAMNGTECALEKSSSPAAKKTLPSFIAELRTLTSSRSDAILIDDRSSAFEVLVDALKAKGSPAEAKAAAADWAAMLEGAATRASSPKERAVFDPHRLGAYIELGEPQRALPMLEASERDFPGDYNPPARKARALMELGRYDEAVASADRALGLAYGGRRMRIYLLKADIYEKKRAKADLIATLKAALADSEKSPLRASYERLRQSIVDRLRVAESAKTDARPSR